MRRARSPVACAAALAVCAFAAAPAHAQIVPQRGIKGIRLSMSAGEVRAKLGVPDRNTTRPDEIQGRIRIYAYGLTTVTFTAVGRARVIAVSTSSRRERTSRGIGVGSTRASVRENVPGSRCRREFGIDHCYVGSFLPGRRVTDFFIGDSGRVTRVTIGIVID